MRGSKPLGRARGALVLHGTSAVGEQDAGRIMDRNSEPSAHDALGREARPEVRADVSDDTPKACTASCAARR